jgi:hypothetical protein
LAKIMNKNPVSLPWIALVLIAVACSACTSRHATYAPDGRRSYVITCSGFLNSYANCLVKAGRACKSLGYDILKGSEDDREMLVACKATNAKTSS